MVCVCEKSKQGEWRMGGKPLRHAGSGVGCNVNLFVMVLAFLLSFPLRHYLASTIHPTIDIPNNNEKNKQHNNKQNKSTSCCFLPILVWVKRRREEGRLLAIDSKSVLVRRLSDCPLLKLHLPLITGKKGVRLRYHGDRNVFVLCNICVTSYDNTPPLRIE